MTYAGAMARLRALWGGACVWSDGEHEGPLEFAHLPGKPTGVCGRGRGTPQRYHDVVANPDCYALLCRGHHMELDGRKRWR